MTAETLIARLEFVRPNGRDRWIARCPAHEDRDPSLSVSQRDDGRVLIHCFAGCSPLSILDAVGLAWGDLYPPDDNYRPLFRARHNDAVEHARMVLLICKADRQNGKKLSKADLQREREAWTLVRNRRSA